MKAILLYETSDVENFKYEEMNTSVPKENEVLITVKAIETT